MSALGTETQMVNLSKILEPINRVMPIDDRGIDDQMLELLIPYLITSYKDIRILSLTNNLIGDQGFKRLSEILPLFPQLRFLYLSK